MTEASNLLQARAILPVALSIATTTKYSCILSKAFFTSGDDRQSLCLFVYNFSDYFINFDLNIIGPFQKERFIKTIFITSTGNTVIKTFEYAALGLF